MQRIGRLVLIGLVVAIVILGVGYAWGVSGRRALQTALDDTSQRLDAAEARAELLDARVSIYNMNFGDASRRMEGAKDPLRREWLFEDRRAHLDRDLAVGQRVGSLRDDERLP